MKTYRTLLGILALLALVASSQSLSAAEGVDGKDKDAKKAKPYPLKTCLISDETLDADPAMKTYAFVHEGQEIKLCCKSCQKDFKKNSAKYLKKMKEVAAKEANKGVK